MIFNSLTFLIFLVISVGLYWALPRRPRLWMLFLGSLAFYGFWRVEFLPVMLASTLVDYVAARVIHTTEDERRRRIFLAPCFTTVCPNVTWPSPASTVWPRWRTARIVVL